MLRQLITLLILLMSSTVSLAVASLGKFPPPTGAAPPAFYIDGDVGYNFRNWTEQRTSPYNALFAANPTTIPSNATTNGTGWIAGGLDIGLLINKYLGAELGAFYLPKVSGNYINPKVNPKAKVSNHIAGWMLYISGKMHVPIMKIAGKTVVIFNKIGISYVESMPGGAFTSSTFKMKTQHDFSLFVGSGAEVYIMPALYVGVEYVYVPGNGYFRSSNSEYTTANSQMVLAFAGYQLSL